MLLTDIKSLDTPRYAIPEESGHGPKLDVGAPELSLRQIAIASVGITAAISCVGWLATVSNTVLVLGSFGSSCVLLFAYPASPFSRARNFVGGHFVCSLIGLLFLHVVGSQWWAMALATGTAFAVMMLTRTIHPPAGSNPVIVYLVPANWSFLWVPTLLGTLAIQIVVLAHHSAIRRVRLHREQDPNGGGIRARWSFAVLERAAHFIPGRQRRDVPSFTSPQAKPGP